MPKQTVVSKAAPSGLPSGQTVQLEDAPEAPTGTRPVLEHLGSRRPLLDALVNRKATIIMRGLAADTPEVIRYEQFLARFASRFILTGYRLVPARRNEPIPVSIPPEWEELLDTWNYAIDCLVDAKLQARPATKLTRERLARRNS